jgi:hypothetical protein
MWRVGQQERDRPRIYAMAAMPGAFFLPSWVFIFVRLTKRQRRKQEDYNHTPFLASTGKNK